MALMKKFLVWVLILLSLMALLLRFSNQLAAIFLGVEQTSGMTILSEPTEAIVFLDGQEVGKTPFEDKNLDVKEYTVRLDKNQAFWQGKLKLNAGTMTVIKRDIASDSAFSAGEILSLNRGKGITIISNPSSAEVEIDGKAYGQTPLTVDINPGEHTILVNHVNYLNRSIKADLPKNFNLTISVDLSLSKAQLEAVETPAIPQVPEVIVKQTPTGFLRVRDKASLNGKEIAQVKPGDVLILLVEQVGWDRVRLASGVEGFVASSYVEKKAPQ